MIDVLVPVLGRPQNVGPLIESFRRASDSSCELFFLCSPGDEEEIAACLEKSGVRTNVVDWPPERSDYPRKMNHGFRMSEHPFLLLGADDIDFQPGWDEEALRVAEETNAGVIGTDDGANPLVLAARHSTHPLVRRSYIDEQGGSLDGPGVLIHEGYDHNFSEHELVALAQSRGEWAFAKESRILARHPFWGTAPNDATYAKGRAHLRDDKALFRERARLWGGHGLNESVPWRRRERYRERKRQG